METVQLQCGSCNKLMAISVQHLGGQVRCPHCRAVVQTARPEPATVPPPLEIHAPREEAGEVESIFSPPAPSDDLFDAGPPRSLVEMPPEPQPLAPPPAMNDTTIAAPRPRLDDSTEAAPAPPADDEAPDLTAVDRPRAPVDRGYVSLMLLIFLVPYSIMMTLFCVYLWYVADSNGSGLKVLPDPTPKKDGARTFTRIKHDMELAKSLKVPLGGTLRVGEIEVTPKKVKVLRGPFDDLVLVMRAKNVSTDQAFSPMNFEFLKSDRGNAQPYTFVETKQFQHIYGGQHLDFDRGGEGLASANEGDLKPGEAEDIILTTRGDKDVIKRILDSTDDVTWRVQVRRGLMPSAAGGKVSATAVVGVVFKPSEIEVVKGG